jgi:dTDP-4-amino-4,6-dideoxygalactose transaminase
MTDINAALGLVELERYDSDMLVKRKSIFDKYNVLLEKYDWANIPVYKTEEKQSCFHIYMLRINNATEDQRDRIIDKISAKKVAVNVHFQPLPLMTAYKEFDFKMEDYPVAWNNYQQEISLPVFYDITDEQIGWVIDALVSAVEEVI